MRRNTRSLRAYYREKPWKPGKVRPAAPPVRTECPAARREQDEMVCPRCAMRWPVNEDRPKCDR